LIATVHKVYLSSVSIGQIGKFLPNQLFRRIHRSYIVSLSHVDHFENDAAYIGTIKLPIAEQYRSNFRKAVTIVNGELRTIRLDNDDVDKLLRDLNP
jgi:DNA-binding LytR/AlgR family response regulator